MNVIYNNGIPKKVIYQTIQQINHLNLEQEIGLK